MGVGVTGSFGQKPTLTIPAGAAPKDLAVEVLDPGKGAKVQSGQTLVVNYLGQTWDLKSGKPNVFDNSYDRSQPTGFAIGVGKVIPGWDQALVGQSVGSRVVMAIPPALAYGATPSAQNALGGQSLVFVVDIIDALDKAVAAHGVPAGSLPAGLPAVTSQPGQKPAITSVSGVRSANKATSGLLITGDGDPIDPSKSLALQIIQTDVATGKETQETWGTGPQLVPAQQVLDTVGALKGQKVGSRAVVVTSAQATQPAVILVVDVVGQY